MELIPLLAVHWDADPTANVHSVHAFVNRVTLVVNVTSPSSSHVRMIAPLTVSAISAPVTVIPVLKAMIAHASSHARTDAYAVHAYKETANVCTDGVDSIVPRRFHRVSCRRRAISHQSDSTHAVSADVVHMVSALVVNAFALKAMLVHCASCRY